MSGEAKRRFLTLAVGEVSIVGEPANEHDEWLVQKQKMEGLTMGEAAGAEAVVVKDANTAGGDTTAVLKEVNGIVETLCKHLGGSKPTPAAMNAEVEKGKMTLKGFLKKAGLSDDQMEKAAAVAKEHGYDVDKALPPALAAAMEDKMDGKGKDQPAKTKKEMDGEASTTKAKTLTPGRVEKLQAAKGMIEEILADAAPPSDAVPPNLPPGKSPGRSEITSTTKSQFDADALGAVVKNAVDAAVSKALEPVVKELDSAKAQLAEVQKARSSGNSLENDGGTDVKVAKGKSLWGGIL